MGLVGGVNYPRKLKRVYKNKGKSRFKTKGTQPPNALGASYKLWIQLLFAALVGTFSVLPHGHI